MKKLEDTLKKSLAKEYARRFISRTDVFAQQQGDGSYRPVRRKITQADLLAHLDGEKTFGHYLLDENGETKIFCIDIDFNLAGWLPSVGMPSETSPDTTDQWAEWDESFTTRNILGMGKDTGAWYNRADPARDYLKESLNAIVQDFLKITRDALGVPAIAAYSGHKGAHVYGFLAHEVPGKAQLKRVNTAHARRAAELVLEQSGLFEQKAAGSVFWRGKQEYASASLFTCEVYPKQMDSENIQLGNLLRLPLGRHLKRPGDPTFWIKSDINTRAGSNTSLTPDAPDALLKLA